MFLFDKGMRMVDTEELSQITQKSNVIIVHDFVQNIFFQILLILYKENTQGNKVKQMI